MPRHNKPTSGTDLTPTGELRECPDFFDDVQRQCWAEFVADVPPDVLKNADNWAVENISRLQAKIRSGDDKPAVYAQLVALQDRFGMNPKARPNVKVPPKKSGNPFAEI